MTQPPTAQSITGPMPSLFVSHGSPMMAIEDGPARRFLSGWAEGLARPSAILVATAHWEADRPSLSAADGPTTVHDFGGFPRALYELRYPAPGAPALARDAAGLLAERGIEARLDPARGFDHGVWVPLMLMYPQADIPVVSLSVQPGLGPRHHLAMGEALRPLRERGVLVVGSGSLTHNLAEFFHGPRAGGVPDWVSDFAGWIAERIGEGDAEALADYRTLAPAAARNHPTEEHLLPLFVALGAATPGRPGRRVHSGVENRVLAMDAYAFD